MCGLAGFIGWRQKDLKLQDCLLSLSHRGPDHRKDEEIDEQVYLCHARLSIFDLDERGNQPMHSADGRYSIVYNGEVYNYNELRYQLKSQGVSFNTKTDTEVVLKSFIQWGKGCLSHFRGMFALAIYDKVEKNLFAARDRLGIKPFYFHYDGKRLAFASEVRALIQSGVVKAQLDSTVLRSYLMYQSASFSDTFISNITSLMPGQYLTYSEGEFEKGFYWKASSFLDKASHNSIDAPKILKEEIISSVELRLQSDVPLGSFLSGGIDSSILAGITTKILGKNLETFTVGFDEDGFNDIKYARNVAKRLNTNQHDIFLDLEEIPSIVPEALRSMDQPSADGINSWMVSRSVKNVGITVALSGLGGDELFGGYEAFRRMILYNKYHSLLPALSFLLRFADRLGIRSSRLSRLQTMANSSGLHDFYGKNREFLNEFQVNSLLPDDNSTDPYEAYLKNALGDLSIDAFDYCSYAELTCYMQNVLLRDTDQMSMAHALEVRVPFLDHKIVEGVFKLEVSEKFNGQANKSLLRTYFGELLPKAVWERPKQGFVMPWEKWLKGPLREFAEIQIKFGKDSGLFNPDGVAMIEEGFKKGSISWSRYWLLVSLFHWIKENNVKVYEPHY